MSATVDVLMVTYRRPTYTRRALGRLLEADDAVRVWLWHNGDHAETLEVVRALASHPRVHRFHHSPENQRLRVPTNWLWEHSDADFVAKVDDDCLVAEGWTRPLVAAHEDWPGFGVLAGWRFQDEDFDPELAAPKIATFPGGHRVLQNLWVQGSSYVLPTRHVRRFGPLAPGQSFTQYCKQLAVAGLVNGWILPFVREDHMDDPRSPNTELRTDDDLRRHLPLSARENGVRTLADWEASIRRSAYIAQSAPLDPRRYRGWRKRLHNGSRRIQRLVTGRHW